MAVDESAKIDLNTAREPLLKGLMQNVGGLDPEAAQRVVEAIADWRDPDELRRPNGAEAADYRAAGLKYAPTNGHFAVVGELQRVLGMTPALFAKVAESLTVYSRQAGINPATASRDVLMAIPNASAEVVDAYIALRKDALANKLAVPPFPAVGNLATRAIPVWRIRGQATMPDGVTFIREAVMRLTPDVRRPTVALLWQEGSPLPPPQPDGSATPADPAMNADGNRNR
jgi:general secretion pathway protein K